MISTQRGRLSHHLVRLGPRIDVRGELDQIALSAFDVRLRGGMMLPELRDQSGGRMQARDRLANLADPGVELDGVDQVARLRHLRLVGGRVCLRLRQPRLRSGPLAGGFFGQQGHIREFSQNLASVGQVIECGRHGDQFLDQQLLADQFGMFALHRRKCLSRSKGVLVDRVPLGGPDES